MAGGGARPTSLWRTPTPYLFLGFAFMMGLIAVALLLLPSAALLLLPRGSSGVLPQLLATLCTGPASTNLQPSATHNLQCGCNAAVADQAPPPAGNHRLQCGCCSELLRDGNKKKAGSRIRSVKVGYIYRHKDG